MTKKNIIVLFIFLISMFFAEAQEIESCSCKKRRFKLIKREGLQIDTSLVRTTGIYMMIDTIIDKNKNKSPRFNFYRFFENGQVFQSCGYASFPTFAQVNNYKYGFYGEYKIENNSIVMESRGSYSGYILTKFKIDKSAITRTHVASRSKKPKYEPAIKMTTCTFVEMNL